MAAARREPPAALIEQLLERPGEFDFFQAVRLLELHGLVSAGTRPVGGDAPPAREAVRLRTRPSLAFAGSEVHSLRRRDGAPSFQLDTTFLGMVGTAGVLPRHYTASVIERLQQKDSALRDFLDLFHHRALSLFYRAWCKYRFPVAFTRSVLGSGREDSFTLAAFALVGLGSESLRRRHAIDDGAFVHVGGLFARTTRTAAGLEQVVEGLFGVPARVRPFVGRWLRIPARELCRLPRRGQRGGVAVQLGRGATLGDRVWDVNSKVRLHLGPVDVETYQHLAPGGAGHHRLLSLVRLYLGQDLDFDLELELEPGSGPGARLAGARAEGSQLGRDAWLGGARAGRALTGAFQSWTAPPPIVED